MLTILEKEGRRFCWLATGQGYRKQIRRPLLISEIMKYLIRLQVKTSTAGLSSFKET